MRRSSVRVRSPAPGLIKGFRPPLSLNDFGLGHPWGPLASSLLSQSRESLLFVSDNQVAFATLLRRLPEIRVAKEPVEYTGGFIIRGHKAMSVEF